MAEQEVIKHTQKVYKTWTSHEHSFAHKLKEFVIEIVIIVFAVTLSIWLHSWSEHNHEQKKVKTFLIGLKEDLRGDSTEIEDILLYYKERTDIFTYLSSLHTNQFSSLDSLTTIIPFVNGNYYLRPRKTRFSGFLSAGKILEIENDSLVQTILEYYQQIIPELQSSESAWIENSHKLTTLLLDEGANIENPKQYLKTITTTRGKGLIKTLIPWEQLIRRCKRVRDYSGEIIKMIDKMYPEH